MLAECFRNVGQGFSEEACSTRADVAPGEIIGSSFHRCLPSAFQRTHCLQIHIHIRVEHSLLYNRYGGKVKGGIHPPTRQQWLPPTFTYGFIYLLQGFKFVSLNLMQAAGTGLVKSLSLVDVLSTKPCLTSTQVYILHLQSLLFLSNPSVLPPLP